ASDGNAPDDDAAPRSDAANPQRGRPREIREAAREYRAGARHWTRGSGAGRTRTPRVAAGSGDRRGARGMIDLGAVQFVSGWALALLLVLPAWWIWRHR